MTDGRKRKWTARDAEYDKERCEKRKLKRAAARYRKSQLGYEKTDEEIKEEEDQLLRSAYAYEFDSKRILLKQRERYKKNGRKGRKNKRLQKAETCSDESSIQKLESNKDGTECQKNDNLATYGSDGECGHDNNSRSIFEEYYKTDGECEQDNNLASIFEDNNVDQATIEEGTHQSHLHANIGKEW